MIPKLISAHSKGASIYDVHKSYGLFDPPHPLSPSLTDHFNKIEANVTPLILEYLVCGRGIWNPPNKACSFNPHRSQLAVATPVCAGCFFIGSVAALDAAFLSRALALPNGLWRMAVLKHNSIIIKKGNIREISSLPF